MQDYAQQGVPTNALRLGIQSPEGIWFEAVGIGRTPNEAIVNNQKLVNMGKEGVKNLRTFGRNHGLLPDTRGIQHDQPSSYESKGDEERELSSPAREDRVPVPAGFGPTR